jgi:23S rRNA (uracil1939-C5)-methyltransferase
LSSVFRSTVRALSQKGLGVVDHPDGRVFFVRGTWPGDVGSFAIEDSATDYSEASLLELQTPSSERNEIICAHRGTVPGKCGGCPWMMASYDSQLRFKTQRLKHCLDKRRIQLSSETLRDILPSPHILGYRNRAQLKTDGQVLGYVSEGTRVIAPIADCLILTPPTRQLLQTLRESLPREDMLPTEGHPWCFVDIDDDMGPEEVTINRRRPFKQGNDQQNERMRQWVADKFSQLPLHWPVIDLCCGSGNFTEVLSNLGFTNILAVEVQGVALKKLAAKNLPGVRILELDINEQGAWSKIARWQPHARAMLVDPPRQGLVRRRGLFKYLDSLQELFYISCEAETFARDAEDILKHGWQFNEVTPLDLFPHTPHVEVLGHLSKK